YEIRRVPDLLQTEDYARAAMAHIEPRDHIDQRLALLRRRQEHMRASGRRLWAIVDEGALRRQVGGPEVMRAQIDHLIELAELKNITLQVLPFSTEAAVGGVGSVTLLRFPQAELDDIVYLELLAGALYYGKDAEVAPYRLLLNDLGVQAPPPRETAAFLRAIRDEIGR